VHGRLDHWDNEGPDRRRLIGARRPGGAGSDAQPDEADVVGTIAEVLSDITELVVRYLSERDVPSCTLCHAMAAGCTAAVTLPSTGRASGVPGRGADDAEKTYRSGRGSGRGRAVLGRLAGRLLVGRRLELGKDPFNFAGAKVCACQFEGHAAAERRLPAFEPRDRRAAIAAEQ
jgi:hypothetical protein